MLLSVLFSNLFWIAFFVVGFVVGTITFKRMAPKFFRYVTTGQSFESNRALTRNDYWDLGVSICFNYMCWPLIVCWYILCFSLKFLSIIFSKLIWVLFKKAVIYMDKAIPNYKIVKED